LSSDRFCVVYQKFSLFSSLLKAMNFVCICLHIPYLPSELLCVVLGGFLKTKPMLCLVADRFVDEI
jgi:hypothetical protein